MTLQELVLWRRYRHRTAKDDPELEEARLEWFLRAYEKAYYILGDQAQARSAALESIDKAYDVGVKRRKAIAGREEERKRSALRWFTDEDKRPAMRKPANLYPASVLAELCLYEATLSYERAKRRAGQATIVDGLISYIKFILTESLKRGAFSVAVGVTGAIFAYRIFGCTGRSTPPMNVQFAPIWSQLQELVPLKQAREVYKLGNEPSEKLFRQIIDQLLDEFSGLLQKDTDFGIRRKLDEVTSEHELVKKSLRTLVPGGLECDLKKAKPDDYVEAEILEELRRSHMVACPDCLPKVTSAAATIPPEQALRVVDMRLKPIDHNGGDDRQPPPSLPTAELTEVRENLRALADEKGTAQPSDLVVKIDAKADTTASAALNKTGSVKVVTPYGAREIEVWAPTAQGDKQVLLASIPVFAFETATRCELPAGQMIEFTVKPSPEAGRVQIEIRYTEQDWVRLALLWMSRARRRVLPKRINRMAHPTNEKPNLTQLLQAWSHGDETALEQLYPLVEAELKRQAHNFLRRERRGHPLQTTELVDEALLRLVAGQPVEWQNRVHFFAVAATKMRQILVDHARKRLSGEWDTLSGIENEPQLRPAELIALDDALKSLAEIDLRKSRIVELRFFVGLNYDEIADLLRLSRSTVAHEWLFAKAWLCAQMSGV